MNTRRVPQAKGVRMYFVDHADYEPGEFERAIAEHRELCELEYRDCRHQWKWEYWLKGSKKDGGVRWCVWTIEGFSAHQQEGARRAVLARAADYGFCAVHIYRERRANTDGEVAEIKAINRELVESREAVCV